MRSLASSSYTIPDHYGQNIEHAIRAAFARLEAVAESTCDFVELANPRIRYLIDDFEMRLNVTSFSWDAWHEGSICEYTKHEHDPQSRGFLCDHIILDLMATYLDTVDNDDSELEEPAVRHDVLGTLSRELLDMPRNVTTYSTGKVSEMGIS